MANPVVSHRKRRSPERWSDLPGELLYTIFANLANPLDVYRCGIVCVSWKSVIKTILPHFLLHNSNIYNRFGNDNKFMFFNILTKKIHKMPVSKILGRFSTSNFGRLLTVAFLKIRDTYRIRLLNPFSGQEIKLPSLTDREYSTVKLRAITSTSPSDPNCLVLAFAVNLFFCRPGDEDWIKIHGFWNACSDIIFYMGHFYVVNFDNDLFCIHCNGPVTSEKLSLQPNEFQRILIKSRHCSYLVELDGNLLLVVRYVSSEVLGYPRTFRFQVYGLN
ncbi:hypothetical protein LWI29_030276 [Acer saccharum]|uniref:F-box domain-containing protein n=1 Tax=Acer saccharum TaxID=4024 RepID=A0AA39SYM8_ACESA|nr:hypothetical protein LWI29_030276 [Acer saccharum]